MSKECSVIVNVVQSADYAHPTSRLVPRRETDDSHAGSSVSEITTLGKDIRRNQDLWLSTHVPNSRRGVDISQLDEITASEQNLRMWVVRTRNREIDRFDRVT